MLQFDLKSHRYRDTETGRYVGAADVLHHIQEEVNRTEVRLKAHARLLTVGKIDLPEFQSRMAQTIKEAHLRTAMVGAGGKDALTPSHYGQIGAELRKQYKYLYQFGLDLADGKLSPNEAINRAGSYGKAVRNSFYKAEFTSRDKLGQYAKRLLDSRAQHCDSCLGYQKLQWTLLKNITPPGVDCQCGGNCRCRIIYRVL